MLRNPRLRQTQYLLEMAHAECPFSQKVKYSEPRLITKTFVYLDRSHAVYMHVHEYASIQLRQDE